MSRLFVTGMQRSGTTLLDKLLGLLSQPFPLLLVAAKRAFLATLGEDDLRYPLAPLFREERYRAADFTRFLAGYRWDAGELARLFQEMEGFSGQYHRWDLAHLAGILPAFQGAGLSTVAERLCGEAGGFKETTGEEFLPYFLERGWRCLLLLRDPRDVLASLNAGRGEAFAGRRKPTLFNLRQWRKSVAFALGLAGRAGFQVLRYEDLVADPFRALDGLGASGPGALDGWAGNSSHTVHRGIGSGSVGTHAAHLPPEVTAFVEAACHPEMRLLGYATSLSPDRAPEVLRAFQDPWVGERPELAPQDSPASREDEVRRLELLAGPEGDLQPWFLFPEAFAALREAR